MFSSLEIERCALRIRERFLAGEPGGRGATELLMKEGFSLDTIKAALDLELARVRAKRGITQA